MNDDIKVKIHYDDLLAEVKRLQRFERIYNKLMASLDIGIDVDCEMIQSIGKIIEEVDA